MGPVKGREHWRLVPGASRGVQVLLHRIGSKASGGSAPGLVQGLTDPLERLSQVKPIGQVPQTIRNQLPICGGHGGDG